jgi:glycosyltransferase involved in cell wall biosynthesis
VDFTIVTPSFGQLEKLAGCIASIADQEGVQVEHFVQDGGTQGFQEFAETMAKRWPDRPGYRRIMVSQPDKGMYDAINRGLEKAKGNLCAYLNCDEQYEAGSDCSHPSSRRYMGWGCGGSRRRWAGLVSAKDSPPQVATHVDLSPGGLYSGDFFSKEPD